MRHKDTTWVFNQDISGKEVATGLERKVLAYCDELMCAENHFEVGGVGALHSHPHTQITYVVEGVFEFTIDGVTKVVRKGDTMLKQNAVVHGCVCLEKGILLDIFTPMREDFV
ncbi:cupin domain-containing protein [Bengtsoniella intestinalis]|uniref:cupin domain-containing protein n=1 Tax=Bengtsoniella intestinalis TaxID=3073143 RepID=UPI00391F5983